ncbi:ArsR/SmtB family transcription factor [Kitasatospora sp. NPDC088134]|uniref:ArsR/SmtB family transcription factor n=1 Tax=Kitasatospora sp. NPDC088134 TaxID=3364071 RepID=UPI0038192326
MAELAGPASTTDLARRTGITAGGVSQHLAALRAAGLVNAHRSGRYVLYVRTEAAEALLTPQPTGAGRRRRPGPLRSGPGLRSGGS